MCHELRLSLRGASVLVATDHGGDGEGGDSDNAGGGDARGRIVKAGRSDGDA